MKISKLEPRYEIVYIDPPWPYYGDPNKMGAAGKHYSLMTEQEIYDLPVKSLLANPKKGAVFVWATSPKLDMAIEAIKRWGFHYRGVAFVWVKTTQSGSIIGAQGVPPTGTKPTSELLLLATTNKTGRPFPLLDAGVAQVVLAPRSKHSQKPTVFYEKIERLYGKRPRVEVFARNAFDGWDCWGNEAPDVGI